MVILAAVDGEREPDDVVSVGHDLAAAHGEPLTVLHVMSFDEFKSRLDRIEGYEADAASRDARGVAERVAEATVPDPEAEIRPRGRVGETVEHLLEAARDEDARYLVVGGRKRTPVGKAVFGSTTQSVLLEADRPVVAVMRDGD